MTEDLLGPLAREYSSIGWGEPFVKKGLLPALISKTEEAKVSSCIVGKLSGLSRKRGLEGERSLKDRGIGRRDMFGGRVPQRKEVVSGQN